jgi:hypothetical protein
VVDSQPAFADHRASQRPVLLKLLVCGGRAYSNRQRIFDVLDTFILRQWRPHILIEGGASGADRLAAGWAETRGIFVCRCPAPWYHRGRSAGPWRNQMILNFFRPDYVIAFPGGAGTADMVRRTMQAGVPFAVIE